MFFFSLTFSDAWRSFFLADVNFNLKIYYLFAAEEDFL